jgi:putative drug exporter of the RND superfamily
VRVSGWLDRLGRRAVRRRWWFIGAWVFGAALVAVLALGLGGTTIDAFRIPGAQSQEALDLLTERFPSQSGSTATVVFASDAGIDDPSVEPAIDTSVTALGAIDHVSGVSPLLTAPQGTQQGKIGMVTVQFAVQVQDLQSGVFDQMQAAVEPATKAGVRVEFGGGVTDYADRPPDSDADLVGLVAAAVILLLAFGSVIAMGLPIVTSLFGLGVGIGLITVIAAFTDIGTLAPVLGTMIGLGVGIDYSLFIVTRYREGLAEGLSVEEAAGRSVATAGSAVLFAGCTVVIAICGLAISGIPYVARLGYMAGLVVAVMMGAAITLLPAIIGAIGNRIDRWQIHFGREHRSGESSAASGSTTSVWGRWARLVASHAWPFAIVGVVVLLVLAWPLLDMRLGESDDGNLPPSTTQRQAYDLVAAGFGPGANGPLLVAVELPDAGDTSLTDALVSAVQGTPGVAQVLPPRFNSARDVAVIVAFPTTSPDSAQTASLVQHLRVDVLPTALGTSGAHAYIGGLTAEFIDIGAQIAGRLPYFIGAVLVLSFLLLMLVFHSVLVPLTAVAMNLLSVGAAYGAIVAVFQWGWAIDLIGLQETVPIVAFVPMMMFAVLFGLSMDYQVFLLTRVREEYERTGDTREGVVLGLTRTARVITSAALIMIFVFGAFVLNFSAEVKMFGLGLAFAVFVDATVVRMMLVPSIMQILGDANWWFPTWLRWLPRLDIDAPPTVGDAGDVSRTARALARSGGR